MFEKVIPDNYGFDNYVIEIGNQICINPDGTTGNKKSQLHLKKFTDMEIRILYSHSLRKMDIIERKLPTTESDQERISLLSVQIGELSKMLAVSVSMGLRGIEKS